MRQDLHIFHSGQAVRGDGCRCWIFSCAFLIYGVCFGASMILPVAGKPALRRCTDKSFLLIALFGRKVKIMGVLTKEINYYDDETQIQIGKRIKEARLKAGVGSAELAGFIMITPVQFSRIETGKSMCRLEHIYAISQYLDVSVDYLLFGKVETSEEEKEIMDLLEGRNVFQIRKAAAILRAFFD